MTVNSGEWLSQREAAELVGVPVTTVEFAARAGKFVKRDAAPSLYRESVLAWAERRAERKARAQENRKRRYVPRQPRPPEPTGWLSIDQAAARLGLVRASVLRLAGEGAFEKRQSGRQHYVREDHVRVLAEQRAADRAEWISAKTACAIVGASEQAIFSAVEAGRIEQRDAPRHVPSLRSSSVEAFARQWADQKRQAEQRRREAAARSGPPDDGDGWVTPATLAEMIGVSQSRVRQLLRSGRVDGVRRGGRWWVRQADAERLSPAAPRLG